MAQKASSRLGVTPPTLGFLADLLEDGYQSAIAEGVVLAAKNAGANVLCFAGGVLEASERSALQRNHIYQLVGPKCVDALVVLGGTLVNCIGRARLAEHCARFRPIPLTSIGADLPGIPSVLVDNEAGMQSVIEHLVTAHDCRRIAFVRGPLANVEAELRHGVYRQVLATHGLAFDDRLVVVGNFQAESGRAAVACLLDERKIGIDNIDAIVVSNDNMAFGVLEALQERGIRVPTDVAVTGFDDVEAARYTNPGLTTVRQPLQQQGREAVRLVMLALQQGAELSDVLLRAELIVRGSCGCAGLVQHRPSRDGDVLPLGFESSLVSCRHHIIAQLSRAARGGITHAGPDWEIRLVNATASELRGDDPGATVRFFEGFVFGLSERGLDTATCHDVLDCLRREMLTCLQKEPERRALAENLFQDIRLAIAQTAERMQGARRLRLEHWARQLTIVGTQLIGTFDMTDLRDAMAKNFPSLGIASCFLVTHDFTKDACAAAKLVLAYDKRIEQAELPSIEFEVEDLLPGELLGHALELRNYLVAPLFFKQEMLGYWVIEFEASQAFAYESIRDLVSAALKGAMLVADSREHRDELELALRRIRQQDSEHAALLDRIRAMAAHIDAGATTNMSEIRGFIQTLLEGH